MRLFVTFLAVVVFIAALGFASVMGLYAYYAHDLPNPDTLAQRQFISAEKTAARSWMGLGAP